MEPKKLLFAAPPLVGHTTQLLVLAEEMVRRGHRVFFANGCRFEEKVLDIGATFFEWDPERDLTDSELLERYRGLWEFVMSEPDVVKCERAMWQVVADSYSYMHSSLLPLLRRERFDLVVADSVSLPAMDLARQHRIPVVVLAQFLGDHVRAPLNLPQFGTSFPREMSLGQRALNAAHPFRMLFNFRGIISKIQRTRRASAASHNLPLPTNELCMLVASAFGLEIPRSLPPHVTMVGPLIPERLPTLEPGLRKWLDEDGGNRPVVYVSSGSLFTPHDQQICALVDGLIDDRHRILWSLRSDKHHLVPTTGSSVRVESFLPQQAVLAHPSVKLSLSHCGMNSVSESLYFGKPILALPLVNDQHYNAARVVDAGAGLLLDSTRLRPKDVRASAALLLENDSYRQRAERVSALFKGSGGLPRAVCLLEMILRTGYPHICSSDVDLSPTGEASTKDRADERHQEPRRSEATSHFGSTDQSQSLGDG